MSTDAPTITGTIYLIDNVTAADGSLSSLSSRRPSTRALTVSGTSSAQPRGVARSFGHGGKPALLFADAQSQYAQDQNADAATVIAPLTAAGSGFVARLTITDAGAGRQLLGNWAGSSNANALSIYWNGSTEVLSVFVTNKGGGGRVLIGASTTAADVRVGDTVTITLLHQSNQTWIVEIVREPRDNETSTTTINLSGGPYGGTIDTSATPGGLTLGAFVNLTGFSSMILHSFVGFTIGASTAAEVAAYKAWLSAQCTVTRPSYVATSALASTDYDVDNIHWVDAGHSKMGALARLVEQDAVTRAGLTGTIKVGVLGDSRPAGASASAIGTTDFRTIAHTGATFTRSRVGPISDAAGNHFARSGYTTRSFGAQTGHSPYTSHATSIDAYVGSGKSYNDTQLWTIVLGYNDLSTSPASLDWVYELDRLIRYLVDTQRAQAGVTPAFAILSEPATWQTTTGALQRRIRARNHQVRVMAARLAELGIIVSLGNSNDWTRAA